MKLIREKRLFRNLVFHMFFIDLEKAYSSFSLSKRWLGKWNQRPAYSSRTKIGEKLSEVFLIIKGYVKVAQWLQCCYNIIKFHIKTIENEFSHYGRELESYLHFADY